MAFWPIFDPAPPKTLIYGLSDKAVRFSLKLIFITFLPFFHYSRFSRYTVYIGLYNGKTLNNEKPQKGVKNEFRGEIESSYPKDHKLRLKMTYLILSHPHPLGGRGSNMGQNAFFGNFESIFAVSDSFQSKTNARFGFSKKKIFKIPNFSPAQIFCWLVLFFLAILRNSKIQYFLSESIFSVLNPVQFEPPILI